MKYLLVALSLFVAVPAEARVVCDDRDSIIASLTSEKYKETRRSIALADRFIFETYASEEGTWTLLRIEPNGRACVMAVGEGWQAETNVAPTGDPA